MSEKHLPHSLMSKFNPHNKKGRAPKASEERWPWTELARSKVWLVHLNSLQMSSAELSKHSVTGWGPSIGIPSPLILRQEEENLREQKGRGRCIYLFRTTTPAQEGNVIWQARRGCTFEGDRDVLTVSQKLGFQKKLEASAALRGSLVGA